MIGRLRVVILVVLALLVILNIVGFVHGQRTLPCRERVVCGKPRDLEHLAATATPKTAFVVAVFHYLGKRIGGATLRVPHWMGKYRWELEHVSRVRVEVSPGALLVDPSHVAALRRAGGSRRTWMRRGGSEARWLFQDIFVLVDDTTEYVLAEEGSSWGNLFVIPAARYDEVRVR